VDLWFWDCCNGLLRIGKECVLKRQAYWKWNRLVFNWKFERIGEIDFWEVTKEYVLETEEIGF
jgi:hypothetical protein